jgi:hypothetical protein
MEEPIPRGLLFYFLKVGNILALAFWIFYFADGMLPTRATTEIVQDYNAYGIRDTRAIHYSSVDKPYQKLATDRRNFIIYEETNSFLIGDTLELVTTYVFDVVKKYRKYSTDHPQEWIINKLSRYRSPVLIIGAILLALFTICAVVMNPDKISYYAFCLFSIGGALFYLISILA